MRTSASAGELQEFLATARPNLQRLLVSWRVPVEDAQDLLQEAFVILLRRWDQMADVASREAWLYGTLRNLVLLQRRSKEREQRLFELLCRQPLPSSTSPQAASEFVLHLEAIASHIPQRAFQVLWLRYALELDDREAAEVLGCQPNSVRSIARRALLRVRRLIAENPSASPAPLEDERPNAPRGHARAKAAIAR